MGRDYYSKRFRLVIQHMVEGGPPAAMLEENEEVRREGEREGSKEGREGTCIGGWRWTVWSITPSCRPSLHRLTISPSPFPCSVPAALLPQRWVGLPSFQWKMAVVNLMNQAFLRPKETLGDEYSEPFSPSLPRSLPPSPLPVRCLCVVPYQDPHPPTHSFLPPSHPPFLGSAHPPCLRRRAWLSSGGFSQRDGRVACQGSAPQLHHEWRETVRIPSSFPPSFPSSLPTPLHSPSPPSLVP